MTTKICLECNIDKPLSEYYTHKLMSDGYLNKCKDCTKSRVKKRHHILSKDDSWVKSEQKRHREKYYRLGYKDKHKPTTEQKREIMLRYIEKYPEKHEARICSSNIVNTNGHNHHWSYNKEHYKDVIDISEKDHAKAHRFLIYDQERRMYRRFDNSELLDTKEKHIDFIKWCIENKED